MLGIAIATAAGGLLTIIFAFWVMIRTTPPVRAVVKAAIDPISGAANAVATSSKELQRATEKAAKNPSDKATDALKAANEAHESTTKTYATLTSSAGVKEAFEGLGSVFQDLGTLPPPIAALCVALLMFLTAGGIEFAGIVK